MYSLIFIQIVHGLVKPGSGFNVATPTLHLIFFPVSDETVAEDHATVDNAFPLRAIVPRREGIVTDNMPTTGNEDESCYAGVEYLHPQSSIV